MERRDHHARRVREAGGKTLKLSLVPIVVAMIAGCTPGANIIQSAPEVSFSFEQDGDAVSCSRGEEPSVMSELTAFISSIESLTQSTAALDIVTNATAQMRAVPDQDQLVERVMAALSGRFNSTASIDQTEFADMAPILADSLGELLPDPVAFEDAITELDETRAALERETRLDTAMQICLKMLSVQPETDQPASQDVDR